MRGRSRRSRCELAGAEALDEPQRVVGLRLGHGDERLVADGAVGPHQAEEVGEARQRDREVTVGLVGPDVLERLAARAHKLHRPHVRVRVEAGREHQHVQLV